jgi:hypothetical protein
VRGSKKNDETVDVDDEPLGQDNNMQDDANNKDDYPDFGQDLGNFDIDFEPMDGDSSGGAVSFSPEKMRDGSSIDGASIRASSKRSSRMSADSFDIPNRCSVRCAKTIESSPPRLMCLRHASDARLAG